MSIIIRLQNLPWEANSLDIRRYFQGLSIPDGGVHIVGGDKGDAFIAFSSDEDARQAMERDGGLIKDSRVKLYLSSRNEMQKVIEQARNQTLGIKGNDPGQTAGGPVHPHVTPHHHGLQTNQPPPSVINDPRNHHQAEQLGPPGLVNYPIPGVNSSPGNYSSGGPGQPNIGPGHPHAPQHHHGLPPNQPPPAPLHPSNHHGSEPVGHPGMGNYPMAGVGNLPGSYQEADFRRRSSERDITRGIGDRSIGYRIGNRSRSRSPHYNSPPPIGGNGSTGRPPASYQPPHDVLPPPRDYVVYMKGIPYNSCTERDVADFFTGLNFVDMVFEIDGRTGKPAGNAFVEFATNEDFNAALDMNMKHMGRRYIEVFPTTKEDMNDARMAHGGLNDRGIPPPPRGGSGGLTYCVSVTNLPPTVTNRDLTNYFSEIGAQPFAIHIMLKANGFNAGEAFVEFSTSEQQMKAIRKDGSFMGAQRISVRSVPHDLMRRVVGIPPPGGPAGPAGPGGPSGPGGPGGPGNHGPPPPGPPSMNNGGMDMRHGGPMFPPHGEMSGDPRKMRRGGREDFRGRREKEGRRGGDGAHAGGPIGGGNYTSFNDPRLRY
uniref:RRM domain-containing protein n=1 Tax=Tetranychus urticae TaxID=32264 RepID=T1KCV5_TETUR